MKIGPSCSSANLADSGPEIRGSGNNLRIHKSAATAPLRPLLGMFRSSLSRTKVEIIRITRRKFMPRGPVLVLLLDGLPQYHLACSDTGHC
jgi:hypothetical protein